MGEESENSGIQTTSISVYQLQNSVEVQLYIHTNILVYTLNCMIPYLILNLSETIGELNIFGWGTEFLRCCSHSDDASPTFRLQKT